MSETGETGHGLSPEEIDAALDGPAFLTSRIFMIHTTSGLRITFAEQYTGHDPQFRTAVLLSYQDAHDVGELLVKMSAHFLSEQTADG